MASPNSDNQEGQQPVLQRDALAMKSCMHLLRPLIQRICTLLMLLVDAVRFLLLRRMAWENPAWGEERMANELLLKLGLRVSPRTVRKSLPKPLDHGRGKRAPSQRWRTFVRNHAQVILACDFCLVVTATFRLLYVFVVMAHATRRILHVNVTAHPTAVWTLQQLRDAIP
jgi:hypothetical protein